MTGDDKTCFSLAQKTALLLSERSTLNIWDKKESHDVSERNMLIILRKKTGRSNHTCLETPYQGKCY